MLVVARDHPLARRARVSFAEMLDYDFVGLDRASALQRFLADKASRAGRPIRLRVQLRSFDGVCRLVERNVGVGIVPETTARWAAQTMAIKAVRSPIRGRCAIFRSACATTRRCRPMRASWSITCARSGGSAGDV